MCGPFVSGAEQYSWALSRSSMNNSLHSVGFPRVAVYEPSAVIKAIYFLKGFNHSEFLKGKSRVNK